MKHSEQASPSLLRAIRLESLQRSGCQFRLQNLSPPEWMGLEALREGREMVARETQAEREKENGHREV